MVASLGPAYDLGMQIVIAVIAALAGCGVADFDISQPIPSQTVQGSPLPGPLASLFAVPLNLDISQQIKAMNTGPISSVTLKSLELTITSSGGDWSFVNEIDVTVSSTKSGTSLPKVEISHVTSPGKVTVMNFTVDTSVDLNPYINEGSEVDGTSTGNAPAESVTYDGEGVFTVHPV
jgi:hypothetical protein